MALNGCAAVGQVWNGSGCEGEALKFKKMYQKQLLLPMTSWVQVGDYQPGLSLRVGCKDALQLDEMIVFLIR